MILYDIKFWAIVLGGLFVLGIFLLSWGDDDHWP